MTSNSLPVTKKKDIQSSAAKKMQQTCIFCTLIITLLVSFFYFLSPHAFKILNYKATDTVTSFSWNPIVHDHTLIVAIDDTSLNKHGQWPWPRKQVTQLLQKIKDTGPVGIGINLLLPEKEYQRSESFTGAGDAFLARELSAGPYTLGYQFLFGKDGESASECHSNPKVFNHSVSTDYGSFSYYQATGIICNNEILGEAVTSEGFLNGVVDADGLIRRIPLVIEYNKNVYPSFILSLLKGGAAVENVKFSIDEGRKPLITIDDFNLIIGAQGNMLLGQISPTSNIVSAKDVFSGRIDQKQFENKYVLLGITASGLVQEFTTVNGIKVTSLDVYQQALNNILNKDQTVILPSFKIFELVYTLLLAVAILFFAVRSSLAVIISMGMVTIFFTWLTAIFIYKSSGYLFSPLPTTLIILAISVSFVVIRYKFLKTEADQEAHHARTLLKSSETSLDAIMNTIPDIVFRLDKQGNIIFISQAISKYNKSENNLVGKSIFEIVYPEDAEKATYRVNERRTGERSTCDFEIRLLLKKDNKDSDEGIRYFSVSAEGIYNGDQEDQKQFVGTQGIARDITDRKNLEQKLIESKKLEAIGNLASGVAHDLNNILGGIVSYPELILLDIPENDPLRQKIAVIQKSGEKAAAIVQDLLTLARRNVNVMEVCDINSIIREYLDSLEFGKLLEQAPKTIIQRNLSSSLRCTVGAPFHLSKVIMNVLNNAVEAMPEGGRIVVSTSNITISSCDKSFEQFTNGDYLLVEIEDTGVGINSKDVQSIFEPFFSKKTMGKSGTGLGMSIVNATIDDHQGYIQIDSEEGVGTKISIYLPSTEELVEKKPPQDQLDQYFGTETILIVDDVHDQLEIASGMLSTLGYKVIPVDSGEKAVEIVKGRKVDLVVLDMLMPGGMDGVETYHEIAKIHPGQKAVVTSGFSESEQFYSLKDVGVTQYLQKPFSLEQLATTIRRELDM